MPAGDHATIWLAQTPAEREQLCAFEQAFDREQTGRDRREDMLAALTHLARYEPLPLVIANHPSRAAPGPGRWGLVSPEALRAWQDAAPEVLVGFEGAPGHQAAALSTDGPERRGGYPHIATLGGFDPMVAVLGGVWDGLLAEGRRWWATASSDHHQDYRTGGVDFWPGEYCKTLVKAQAQTPAGIMAALRAGRVIAVTGDLIAGLELRARTRPRAGAAFGPWREHELGATLPPSVGGADDLALAIELARPVAPNAAGQRPELDHIDLIVGGPEGTRVAERWTARDGRREGHRLCLRTELSGLREAVYLRLRGTNSRRDEPEPDPFGVDPWVELWFYSAPVFLPAAGAAP